MLLLAQLLKQDAPPYKGLPQSPEGKAQYGMDLYQTFLAEHMLRDAQVLYPFFSSCESLRPLTQSLLQQNEDLQLCFKGLEDNSSEEELDRIGHCLERYVRSKERQLFEEAQALLSEDEFSELKSRFKAFDS